MKLGMLIVDRGIHDRDGRRVGKVDDLILEIPDPNERPDECAGPEVAALVTGPMALSRNMSRPVQRLARAIHRALGVANPEPTEIPWSQVDAIDVVVHLTISRKAVGWSSVGDAVNRRFIRRLPGA